MDWKNSAKLRRGLYFGPLEASIRQQWDINPSMINLITAKFQHMNLRPAITTIDCRQGDAKEVFRQLRERLSPRGDVVSEAGRQGTIALFGEPLSPREVVRRICDDVRSRGLDAVLYYT